MADDLGLPYWWLNEQASIYISGKTSRQAPRVRPPRTARVSGITSPRLRHEGTRRPDTRHRRSPRACRHHRGGVSRRSPADMRRLLSGRTRTTAIRRCAARAFRVSTQPHGREPSSTARADDLFGLACHMSCAEASSVPPSRRGPRFDALRWSCDKNYRFCRIEHVAEAHAYALNCILSSCIDSRSSD